MQTLLAISLLVLSAMTAIMGCGATEIAENHVAVLSATRWDDYNRELQRQFAMTTDQALAASIPDTLHLQQGLTHQFQAALAPKLAPSSSLPAGFLTGESGASTTQCDAIMYASGGRSSRMKDRE
jgi:hypothetical protein